MMTQLGRRVRFALSISLELASVAGSAQVVAAQVPERQALLQLNRQLLESALLRRDTTALSAAALPNLVVVPPGGIVEDRAQVMRGVSNFAIDSLQIDDVTVAGHGTTAVVLARVTAGRGVQSTGGTGRSRFMSVFVYDQQKWRLLARSVTPCIERAVAAGRC